MNSHVRKSSLKQGFALVVTLSLMILLTVIAVGLLSLSSIALRSSGAGDAEARAMANARLAVMMALGELQKQVGKDQKITANASILREPADGQIQEQLVGVWDSWSPRFTAEPDQAAPSYKDQKDETASDTEPGFRTWLASAPKIADLKQKGWADTKPDATWIKLFSALNDGFDLHALPVKTPRGTLAWGVSQENTKAKINVAGPDNDNGPSNIALQVQPRPSLGLSSILAQPTAGWNERANRVLSINQLKLDTELAANPAASTVAAVSYSVHAKGLLTDVVNGGLKTDLSLGFELDDDDFEQTAWGKVPNPFRSANPALKFSSPNSFGNQQALFKPLVDNPIVSFDTQYDPASVAQRLLGAGVPTFDHLRSFYRIPHHLYGGATPVVAERGPDHVAAQVSGATGGSFPAPSIAVPDVDVHQSTLGIRPVLNRMIYIISPKYDPVKKQLGLVITPVVSLWNPYNIALEIEGAVAYPWIDFPLEFNFEKQDGTKPVKQAFLSDMMGKQFLNRTPPAGRSVEPYFLCELTADGDGNTNKPIRFEPGEVRVFCPTSSAPQRFVRPAALKDKVIPMRPVASDSSNFNLKGGLFVPVLGLNQIDLEPTDKVTLNLKVVQAGKGYHYFSTLEDATRIKDPDKQERGQSVTVVQILNFAKAQAANSPPLSPDSLVLGETPCGAMETYHRTTEPDALGDPAVSLLYTTNPRQAFFNQELTPATFNSVPNFHSLLRAFTSRNDAIKTLNGRSFWGNSLESNGQTQFPFFEIPRQPLLSLSGFQHADLASSAFSTANQFANSFASPYLGPNAVALYNRGDARSGVPIYDHSYLTNEALWDAYFFSGAAPIITPAQAGNPNSAWDSPIARVTKPLDAVVTEFIANPTENPLSNRRMKLHQAGLSNQELKNKFLAQAGCTQIAAHLMVDGAFNINSTDLEAWVAMLSGLRDQPFELDEGNSPSSGTTPFPRFRHPTGTVDDTWKGFRALSDTQVRTLAQNLIEQIRLRGPFQSLAEFVNRQISDDLTLGGSGAVQAAINASGLNAGVGQGTFDYEEFPGDAKDHMAVNTALSTAVGLPGFLTQADVLNSLAPVITCRSDTFIIRGYGEAKDAGGKVLARARCEAVVQRMPEFVDPVNPPEARTAEVDNVKVNKEFGRRFQIVSFRRIPTAEFN